MTQLIPSEKNIKDLLASSGAIRYGHFEFPNGIHSDTFFQMPLALRHYNNVRHLGVALSRLLRKLPAIRSEIPHVTIVAPASGGIPVAFAVREAINAEQVVWAEKGTEGLYFRPYAGIEEGAKCILVDDIILTSQTLNQLKELVMESKGKVLAIGVLVDAGVKEIPFPDIPFVSLIRYSIRTFPDASSCELCQNRIPLEKVRF